MGRILVMSLIACSFYNNNNINSLLFYVLFLHSGYGAHSPLQRKQSKHSQSKFEHVHSNNKDRQTDRQTDRESRCMWFVLRWRCAVDRMLKSKSNLPSIPLPPDPCNLSVWSCACTRASFHHCLQALCDNTIFRLMPSTWYTRRKSER